MRKTMKILVIISIILIILGIVAIGLSLALGLGGETTERVTHQIDGDFSKISISDTYSDIKIHRSAGSECYVICDEGERIKYSIQINEDTLLIDKRDTRRWYEHLIISLPLPKNELSLYLPAGVYDSLYAKTSSGGITITDSDISFANASLMTSSGDVQITSGISGTLSATTSSGAVRISATGSKAISVTTSSGDIELSAMNTESLDIKTTSGEIQLSQIISSAIININSSSGDITLDRCDGGELILNSSSGDIRATLLGGKQFELRSSSGRINCPASTAGGRCKITTSSGDINIEIIG